MVKKVKAKINPAKYYLIIGYHLAEKYKDFPTIRVNLNGQLISEFECDNEQLTEFSARFDHRIIFRSQPHTHTRTTIHKTSSTAKHKIVEIDTSTWPSEGELTIEVLHNYSDYNNGFMKKRSLVSIQPVFLIRKDILDDQTKMHSILKRWVRLCFLSSTKEYSDFTFPWPGILHDLFELDRSIGEKIGYHKGGNYKIKIKIKKKHKTYMLLSDNEHIKGFPRFSNFLVGWYQFYSKKYFDTVVTQGDNLDGRMQTQVKLVENLKGISSSNEDKRDNHTQKTR